MRVWCRGFEVEDGHPRYAVRGGMNALAKQLATGLDVRCSTLAFALRTGHDRPGGPGSDRRAWSVGLDDGTGVDADAVILTCPLPQSFSLMITAAVELPTPLRGTDYDRTLALLTVLDGDPAVPPPGGVQRPGDPFGFIGDNRAKGVSAVPAVTFHATPAGRSSGGTGRPRRRRRRSSRRPRRGSAGRVVAAQLKRWRFATPQAIWPEPCWVAADGPGPLVLAGDAFAGPRVEGAALSGLAAADGAQPLTTSTPGSTETTRRSGTVAGREGARRERRGDRDHGRPGDPGGLGPGWRVLEDDDLLRGHAQPRRRREVGIRVRLAPLDIVGGDQHRRFGEAARVQAGRGQHAGP